MYRLTNMLERRVGLPAKNREGIILAVEGSVEVSNKDYDDLLTFEKTRNLIERGGVRAEEIATGKPAVEEG